jgi:hypothetical protein
VLRQMRCGLKLRDSGHLMPGLENKTWISMLALERANKQIHVLYK